MPGVVPIIGRLHYAAFHARELPAQIRRVTTMIPWLESFSIFGDYVPALAAFAILILVLWGAHLLLVSRRSSLGAEAMLPRQLMMLLLTAVAILVVVLLLPMTETTRAQVLSLLGLVLTGVIALSSTTFVANAMSGLMLRLIRSFRPGDFIRIGGQFGRVTERGLFHTEIQTADRDLTTFPNLYLITNPVTVVHSSGTLISATLSLGYDVSRERIEDLLKIAAEKAGLEEPFVLIEALGDFSVSYRVAGFAADIRHLLTVKSNLHKQVLDTLHGAGIEIVSPSFMNQRRLPDEKPVIPKPVRSTRSAAQVIPEEVPAENIMFDKAQEAADADRAQQQGKNGDAVEDEAAQEAQTRK